MLTRRRFLGWLALSTVASVPLTRWLLASSSGGGAGAVVVPPASPIDWTITSPSASTLQTNLAATLAANTITVTVGGVDKETGYRPASAYNALWTRDHAYVLWHYPGLLTAAQRREFVTYTLSRRTTGAESDPDGGTLPADFIADRIDSTGTATYKNAGASDLPFMDGIHMVILALWSDWNATGDISTFVAQKTAIDACLAAIPRSGNGCVYSDPAAPSVDYGFTDTIKKTGDVAYGTALQAWAYKMCGEMAGDTSYDAARATAEAGLATLRHSSGWYLGSSGNNSGVYDVWATALAVAEGLVSGSDRLTSATTIKNAYSTGSSDAFGYSSQITQYGLVRHLPTGQFWTGTSTTQGTYQNGGYWLTPLWDCVRAVALVDQALALQWAAEALTQLNDEYSAESVWTNVPYEWHNHNVGVGAKGYAASAAIVNRFV